MTPATAIEAQIDGQVVHALPGETVLAVAERAGIRIPTLCHASHLRPEGACRLCLVEVEGRAPQAACHTPLTTGMVVRTATPRLTEMRRMLLALMARRAPAVDPRSRTSPFERLLAEFDVPAPGGAGPQVPLDDSHPLMRFDRGLCIGCRLCLNACEQVQGQFVFGVEGRGAECRLILGAEAQLTDSPCVACGACADVCPTGAMTDVDRIGPASTRATRRTDTICGYCGVGCRVRVETDAHAVLRIDGVPEAIVNRGHLCAKGRFAHGWQRSGDRLLGPLVRDDRGSLRAVEWDEAIALLARRLGAIRDLHGPHALAALASSRSTNEAAYLLQKLFRSVLGSGNVDCCARVCHSSTAAALSLATGTGAATASFADIEEASLIVVAGANPTEAHPVVGARIRQAVLRGAALMVIDPRAIELADMALVHLRPWPGTNVALFNGLARALLDEGFVDGAAVSARCDGLDDLRRHLLAFRLEECCTAARVPERDLRAAARLIGSRGPALFVTGLGLSEQREGVAGVMACCNLALLTGSIGRRGSGMLPLRGQNNVQGSADMGALPDALPGGARIDDQSARRRLEGLWGTPLPDAGLSIPMMYDAAIARSLRAMWIQGEDVVQSDPHTTHVRHALRNLDFLVVQEMFMTETAAMAHVVLPAAGCLEQDGTFTNGERRVQLVRRAVPPPGEARPDWEVIRDVASALGAAAGWRQRTSADVMAEIARAAPASFGGLSHDRLAGDGLQWPCPDSDHPGTSTLHVHRFARHGGRAALACVHHDPPPGDVEHPMLLITGRTLHHYNVGSMTRRTLAARLVDGDRLELHPDDASRLGVRDGTPVRVRSRWGEARAIARISPRMMPGTTFLSFHFPQTGTNRVVGPDADPTSHCPAYKTVQVAIEAA